MFHPIDLLPSRLHWIREQMDRLHDEASSMPGCPALNVWEDGENFYAEAEMPGLALEDVEVTASGSELTISGERKWTEQPGVMHHLRERDFGKFSRTIRFAGEIDADRVQATLRNGVLTVTLPKAEHRKARRIAVKPA
jgi:HSP20 family protein